MIKTLMISILFYSTVNSQDLEIPGYYETDVNLTAELQAIVKDLELDKFFDTNDNTVQVNHQMIRVLEIKVLKLSLGRQHIKLIT